MTMLRPPPLPIKVSNRNETDRARELDRLWVVFTETAALASSGPGKEISRGPDSGPPGLPEEKTNARRATAKHRAEPSAGLFAAAFCFSREHSAPDSWPSPVGSDAFSRATWLAKLAATCPGTTAQRQVQFAVDLRDACRGEARRFQCSTLDLQPLDWSEPLTFAESIKRVSNAVRGGRGLSKRQFQNIWLKIAGEEMRKEPPKEATALGEEPPATNHKRSLKDSLAECYRQRKASDQFEAYIISLMVRHRIQNGRRARGEKPQPSRKKSDQAKSRRK